MTMKFEVARKIGLRQVLVPVPAPTEELQFIHKAQVRSTPDHCPVCGASVPNDLTGHQCDEKWSNRREDANRDLSYHDALFQPKPVSSRLSLS